MLGPQTQLITVVGGGIVGGGEELEDSTVPCMSFFGGILPAESSIDIESFVNGQEGENGRACKAQNPNSYLVFADPYSTNVDKVLEECNRPSKTTSHLNYESDSTISSSIVAGAVSVASHKQQATLAVGTNVLPPGSLIRASFFGNLGLQVVVSQGCRPVGPTYRVTRVNGPAVLELDSMRAIDQLQETIERDCNAQDKEYLQTKGMTRGVLGGIYREQDNTNDELSMSVPKDKATFVESRTKEPQHFVVRQMTGFQPKSGGIVICGRPQVKAGDFFRFHVRSPAGALEDWSKIMKRAKTERVFLGSRAGEPIGALQFSCAARGEALFEERNVDLHHVQDLIQKSTHEDEGYSSKTQKMPPPVAGFFANAEISAVGNSIRMGASTDGISSQQKSFVHGYATVVAVLCDYSRAKTEQCDQSPYPSAESSEIEAIGIMDSKSTSVWA
jgi:small ligand-binding sensory domain FIST